VNAEDARVWNNTYGLKHTPPGEVRALRERIKNQTGMLPDLPGGVTDTEVAELAATK